MAISKSSEHGGWYKDGLRDGFGEAGFPNKIKYKGEWKAGKPNGYGIKTYNDRKVMSGVFKNGELQKSLPKMFVLVKLNKYL